MWCQTYSYLPIWKALPLGWYSVPIQLRIGSWVGLSGLLHTKMVYLQMSPILVVTTNWAHCRVATSWCSRHHYARGQTDTCLMLVSRLRYSAQVWQHGCMLSPSELVSFQSCWVFAETTHVVGLNWNFSLRSDDMGGLSKYRAWLKRQFPGFMFSQVVQRH